MSTTVDSTHGMVQRIRANWARFLEARSGRRAQQQMGGVAPDEVVQGILVDLFTDVLDWSSSDIHRERRGTGLLLARQGVSYLMVLIRRPGSLMWYRRTVEAALQEPRRWADRQGVKCIAVSDGVMLYAGDTLDAGLRDRAFLYLGGVEPPEALYRLSVDSMSGSDRGVHQAAERLLPEMETRTHPSADLRARAISHPRYGLPSQCFAYVGHADYPDTWKLPYLSADGSVDRKRLPKAIQSIVSNYRGTNVRGIPPSDIPDVLVRLGRAAARLGKMPHQSTQTARTYRRLAEILAQVGRLDEVGGG